MGFSPAVCSCRCLIVLPWARANLCSPSTPTSTDLQHVQGPSPPPTRGHVWLLKTSLFIFRLARLSSSPVLFGSCFFPLLESIITILTHFVTVCLHQLQPTQTQKELWNHWGEMPNLQSSLLVTPFPTTALVLRAHICLHSSASIIGRWAQGLFLRYLWNTNVLLDAAETMGKSGSTFLARLGRWVSL